MTQAYDRELEDELELESEDEALSGATSLLREVCKDHLSEGLLDE